MALTSSAVSPEIFRLWSGISLVAGVCERRIWAATGELRTFPNLYTLLVAPPGIGKSIVELVRGLWSEVKEVGSSKMALHVAPDSMTKASLMDTLAKSGNIKLLPAPAPAITYHSLLVAAEEFAVLLPTFDMEYIGVLNSIWQNKEWHKESRRTGSVRELIIEKPQLNILGGAQPAWLASVFPEDAWNTGIGRRVIMIYSGERPTFDVFRTAEDRTGQRLRLLEKLSKIANLWGPVGWSAEATEYFRPLALDGKGAPPVPTHSKLVAYINSRNELTMKLAVVSAISRSLSFQIELVDIKRAIAWLLEAERYMPDIFRAMIGKSDRDVIDELHLFVSAMFARNSRKPVTGEQIRKFLLERVPHDKVESILGAADRANIIARVAGEQDKYVPRPRSENGNYE